MYGPRSPAAFCERYQSLDLAARLEGASPHALVTLLYDELLGAIAVAESAIAAGKVPAAQSQIARARTILIALEAGLDFDRGGAVAAQLGTVYRAMQRRLGHAQGAAAAPVLAELRGGIADIADAWRKVAA